MNAAETVTNGRAAAAIRDRRGRTSSSATSFDAGGELWQQRLHYPALGFGHQRTSVHGERLRLAVAPTLTPPRKRTESGRGRPVQARACAARSRPQGRGACAARKRSRRTTPARRR